MVIAAFEKQRRCDEITKDTNNRAAHVRSTPVRLSVGDKYKIGHWMGEQ